MRQFETIRLLFGISLVLVCAGCFGAEEKTVIVRSPYHLELHSSTDSLIGKGATAGETSHKNGASAPHVPTSQARRDVHEIWQRLTDGSLRSVWRTESVVPDLPPHIRFIAFDIVETWSVSSKVYLLCKKGFDIVFLELATSLTEQVEAKELTLNVRRAYHAEKGILRVNSSNDELDLAIDASGRDYQRYLISSDGEPVTTYFRSRHDYLSQWPHYMLHEWRTFENAMTLGATSTKDAEFLVGKLTQGGFSDIGGDTEDGWKDDLAPQAKAKLFILLLNRLRGEGEQGERTSFADEPQPDEWTPLGVCCVAAYAQLLREENIPLEVIERRSRFYFYIKMQADYYREIIEPRVKAQLLSLGPAGRLEYALNPNPAVCPTEVGVALALLSKDMDSEVRKAVVQNPWTDPFLLLSMFEEEEDPGVLDALETLKKQIHQIPPEDERPMPPGW